MQIVFYRALFGFLPVFIFAQSRKVLRWHHLKYSGHYFVMGMLATAVYQYGFAKGTSLLLSGVAGAVGGVIPIFSFLLAILFIPEEKSTGLKIVGVLVGFIGVAILGRPTAGDLGFKNAEGIFYMVAGSLSIGASYVYARKFMIPLKIPAVALATYQLGFGLFILAFFTSYEDIGQIFTNRSAAIALVLGLGLFGTGIAYVIYYYIVEKLGAISASAVSYLPPVVALMIGALIVGEPIQPADYLATGFIFLGMFLLKRRHS